MTREQWSQLDDDTKKIWSTIPEKFKAIILGKTMDTSSTRRHANVHQLHPDPEPDPIFLDDPEPDTTTPDTVEANKTQQQPSATKYPPHYIRSILSQKKGPKREVNKASIIYSLSASKIHSKNSLMDRGANGGIAGQDVKIIASSDRSVDIQGIDNHQMTDVKIGTVAGVLNSTKGPIIGIMHQYALGGRGHSIHSPGQWEWFKHQIDDKNPTRLRNYTFLLDQNSSNAKVIS